MFESISLAFGMIWRGATFLSLSAGVLIGTIFGALPGLTTTMAMALFVPLTFFMEPLIGIPFLLGLYKGGMFGGSVSAILISTPGTAAAAATVLDGYPLSQQGKAGKALNMALYSSVIGETFGNFVLLLLAGFLATAALAFGPPEYTAILIFSFTVISGLSGDSLLKGLIAAAFGFFLSTIGIDPQYGTSRLTFGIRYLDGGLSVVPVLIGLFAISEILSLAIKRKSADKVKTVLKGKENRLNWHEFKTCLPAMGIGSLIGTGIGILPGLGQTVSCWLAYGFAKKRSKNPEMFGKGSLEGVAAAESGNNAVNGPAMLPMLALGIPGDTVTAILLGAFIAQGMRPGPLLFEQQGVMVYAILLIMLIGNVLFLIIGKAFIPLFSKVTALSNGVLVPIVCALSMIGAYAVNNSVFDVGVMVIFGLVGYLMKIAGLPVAPMVIALLLGDMMETAFSQTIIMGRGTLKLLYQRPISVIFLSITLLIVLKIIYDRIKNKNKKAKIAHEDIL